MPAIDPNRTFTVSRSRRCSLAAVLALRWTGDLPPYVFVALRAGLIAFGLINGVAVARDTWFGPRRLDITRT